MRKQPRLVVFCDFDGTISRKDVGYALFNHFSSGRNDELVPLWKSGQLTTRECLIQEAGMVHATPDEITRFLDQFWLNPGFEEFAELCREQDVDLIILSDGLDFYIEHVLARHGIDNIRLIVNHGRMADNTIQVTFPWDNAQCKRCGSCKGERIAEFRQAATEPIRVVFVGDGHSDICALKQADLVLAKKDLEQHCRSHNIDYAPFDDFHDVAKYLQGLGYLNNDSETGANR